MSLLTLAEYADRYPADLQLVEGAVYVWVVCRHCGRVVSIGGRGERIPPLGDLVISEHVRGCCRDSDS